MTLDEIISNLEDQAKDRESSIDKDDPECIFRTDAKALREAVGLLAELAEYRKTGLTAEEFDKETDTAPTAKRSATAEPPGGAASSEERRSAAQSGGAGARNDCEGIARLLRRA